jgi:hypothetical protein
MKGRYFGVLIVLGVPLAASAQDTTLDYQGYVMAGTSTVIAVPFGGGVIGVASSPISTTATFDASVTFSGSVAQNNLVIDSFAINLTANNGQNFELQDILGPSNFGFTTNGTSLCGIGAGGVNVNSCLTLTTSGDAVTGATIDLQDSFNYHGTVVNLAIGPSGDAFSETVNGGGAYGCGAANSAGVFTYVGPASASPCSMNVSSSTAGVWTAAPEIDSTSAAGGLTLLLGSLLVLRARRVERVDD